jgi:hypothetical protein
MATRRYSINVDQNDHTLTDAVGLAIVTSLIELTVDWDGLISAGLSGQQARMQVLQALEKIHAYIEGPGKFNVNA